MIIEQLLEFNRLFVANRQYEQFMTSKYPDKKLAILSCMDTRLTELLPAALGLKNGDAKIIKNAGGLVISPFDSAMRSPRCRLRAWRRRDNGHRPFQLWRLSHERQADKRPHG